MPFSSDDSNISPSSDVLFGEMLILTVLSDSSGEMPNAVIALLVPGWFDEQAEPLETNTPYEDR